MILYIVQYMFLLIGTIIVITSAKWYMRWPSISTPLEMERRNFLKRYCSMLKTIGLAFVITLPMEILVMVSE